jgi:YbbR domain-containing protein
MLTRLLVNWPYKIIALLIAFSLKWEVAQTNHPHGEKHLIIPLVIRNVPANLIVTDATPNVNVVLTGTGSSLDSINEANYSASINLSNTRAGNNQTERVDIAPIGSIPSDISVDSINPQYALVTEENNVKQRYHVGVTFDRIAPTGLSYGAATVRPPVATVSGAQSSVSRVVRLVVDGSDAVNEETVAPGMLDGFGPVIALDAQQNPVSGVSIMPQQAEVRVPVIKEAGVKQVLVNAEFTGRPTYPYEVTDVDVRPGSVTVQGSPSELALLSVIKAEPIDLSGAESDITRAVQIETPPGLMSVSPASVTITVHIGRMDNTPSKAITRGNTGAAGGNH